MSEIQVGQINSTDGSTAITTGADGYVSFAKTQIGGRRNLIINGAMQVAQRGTSTTGVTTADGYYACDRWTSQTDTGTWTLSQSTDAPSGFAYSFKMDCTSAGTSNADEISLRTRLEGQDLQGLAYGTSDAKSITLSFWVKSNQTGTYSVVFYNQNTTQERSISASYTINAADTWEYKTATISGDTSYNFNNSNTRDFQLIFYFGAASGFTRGTYNTSAWQNAEATNWVTADIPGLGGSTSDYVNITGVQLEVGTVATPHEHISYGEQLALCERYYQKFKNNGQFHVGRTLSSNRVDFSFPFRTEMRTTPTVLDFDTGSFSGYSVDGAYSPFTLSDVQAGGDGVEIVHSSSSIGSVRIWATDTISSTNRPICIQVGTDVAFGAEL